MANGGQPARDRVRRARLAPAACSEAFRASPPSNPTAEIGDRSLQALFERNLRLPLQDLLREGDVRPALARVVGGERLVDNLRFAADQLDREFGELEHRELAGIAEVHGPDGLSLRHEADEPLDQIVDIAE